jgi:hypothetical protein
MGRKLFLSFGGALHDVRRRLVTHEDLDRALYYFGATLEFIHRAGRGGARSEAYQAVVVALDLADQEQRIAYRRDDEEPSFDVLNELLLRHGFGALSPRAAYSHAAVEDAVREARLDLEVRYGQA